MAKVKPLVVCSPQLGISPTSTLGGEVYDREVLKRMAQMGVQIHVYLPKNRPYSKISNLYVKYAPIKHIVPPYLFSLIILPYLFKNYSQVKFHYFRVHSHFIGPDAIIFKIFHPKVKVISHYHLDHEGLLVNLINYLLFKYSDLIIADSYFLKRRLDLKFPNAKKKIVVIHTGVDHKMLKPTRINKKLIEKYKLQNKIVITFLGRFIKRKNPIFLINILSKLPKNTVLLLIGDGPEKEKIINQAKNLNVLDRVIMPGILFGQKKLEYYSISDIFVFPSKNEGFVLAVLEAMSVGIPLVLPKSGAFVEAVKDSVNGFLVKPDSSSDWAEKLNKLIKSPKKRKEMGQASRKRVLQEFTWDIVARKNIQAYKKT